MKRLLLFVLFAALPALAQTTTCPGPTPGSPHICLKWTNPVQGANPSTGVNIYRATATGAENYATPLNATLLPLGTAAFLDTTAVVGTQYFYTTCEVGTGGVLSAPSNEASAQTSVPPNAATGLTASSD